MSVTLSNPKPVSHAACGPHADGGVKILIALCSPRCPAPRAFLPRRLSDAGPWCLLRGSAWTIPKADGRQRPLAIAALEDKIVQGATVMVLNAIYEEDFLGSLSGSDPDGERTMRWMPLRQASPNGR